MFGFSVFNKTVNIIICIFGQLARLKTSPSALGTLGLLSYFGLLTDKRKDYNVSASVYFTAIITSQVFFLCK